MEAQEQYGEIVVNVLPREKQLRVFSALVDGNSERAIERMTGVNRGTISRFALVLGAGALNVHNRFVHDLSCSQVEVDEQWSYIAKKQKRVVDGDPQEFGEAYTFVGLDFASRLVLSFHVGKRDQANTEIFINDVRRRLVVMPQMTSDGFRPYIAAIGGNFGLSIDYCQTVKNYTKGGRRNGGDDHRYEPPREGFITKKVIYGAPDVDHSTTAYVERNNGTMRHRIGRLRRLSYAFSKSLEHHCAAVALNYVHYNFCHIVKTLRVTPAMQAGLTNHVWAPEEFLDALLTAPATAVPVLKPLVHPKPSTASRPLPKNRGHLRIVPSSSRVVRITTQLPSPALPAQLELFNKSDDPDKT